MRARCGTGRRRSCSPSPRSAGRRDERRRPARDLRARGLRRLRGRLEGVHHAAHAPDVRGERDPRDHPGRGCPRHRGGGFGARGDGRAPCHRAGHREPRRRLRRHRPHARDVQGPAVREPAVRQAVVRQVVVRQAAGGLPLAGRRRPVKLLSSEAVELLYLVAAVCFILALKGLSSPRSARRGNLIGAAGAAIALVATFFSTDLKNLGWILVAIALGTALAVPAARRVQMTQMPQLVALFNGVGGGAAAIVALLELSVISAGPSLGGGSGEVRGNLAAIAFTVLVGSVSFAGSVVTFLKLQELMTTRPVVVPGAAPLLVGGLVLAAVTAVAVFVTGDLWVGLLLLLVGLVLGLMLVL